MACLRMRFPNWKKKVLTLSYDDAVIQDMKLVEILNKNGIKGTFNINSALVKDDDYVYPENMWGRMKKSDVLKIYDGHEVAVHALTHTDLTTVPPSRATYEVIEDKRKLEEWFGYTIRGMAYPYGTFNDTVVEILKNSGIVYSRTTVSRGNFIIPEDWLRLSATCHHDSPEMPRLADEFINMEIKGIGQSAMFYMWGHSYEFDDNDNWGKIEEFAAKMGGRDDIWYATNIEIFDYITAFKRIDFSTDMSFAENPTTTELYFEWDYKPYVLKAGEKIKID